MKEPTEEQYFGEHAEYHHNERVVDDNFYEENELNTDNDVLILHHKEATHA